MERRIIRSENDSIQGSEPQSFSTQGYDYLQVFAKILASMDETQTTVPDRLEVTVAESRLSDMNHVEIDPFFSRA